jgi:hypothetical protein
MYSSLFARYFLSGVAWLGPQLRTSNDHCFIVGPLRARKKEPQAPQDAQNGRPARPQPMEAPEA